MQRGRPLASQANGKVWEVLARVDGAFISLFVQGLLGGTCVKTESQIDSMVRDFISVSEGIEVDSVNYNLSWGGPFSQSELDDSAAEIASISVSNPAELQAS